jgi:hypothetical protein
MYADVEIAAGAREGLVVPRDALVDTGDHQYVFVEVEPMRFQPRRVTVDSESRRRATVAAASQGGRDRADIPIDRERFPEKYGQWIECERAHAGMGSMVQDCQNAIPKPWK